MSKLIMKKLPIGKQDFAQLIKEGNIYVDKTEIIHKLISTGSVYFLSRPRRFGKSLLVSTLKEIFSGNKEIFKGFWIYNQIEWKKHPVIHIDFSRMGVKELGAEKAILKELDEIAKEHEITLASNTVGQKFEELILGVAQKGKVAILIDEYDKPIIDYIDNIPVAIENRDILKNFYSCLKGLDEHIHFLFLTGVSKFSKVSIFSDLNHLNDITLDYEYATLLGYTEKEIEINFSDYLRSVIERSKLSLPTLNNLIKKWYNGYCWHSSKERVYNPFSILNFFSKKEFENFWFATGTPTFLINFIKNQKKLPEQLEFKTVTNLFFEKFEIENLDIFSLMFQTGYLTINKKTEEGNFILSFPNYEVRNSFLNQLLESYSFNVLSNTTESLIFIKQALNNNDWSKFVANLNILFASIPNQIFKSQSEFFYHAIIHSVLTLCGVDLQSELQTSTGRIDTVIKTEKFIYIVEFKMGTAKEAIEQIKQKEYYKPWLNVKKEIFIVGIGFDKRKKNIGSYISEKIKN